LQDGSLLLQRAQECVLSFSETPAMRRLLLSACLVVLLAGTSPAATHTVSFTVSAGKHDRSNEPVCVPVKLPDDFLVPLRVNIEDDKGKLVAVGQVSRAGLATERDHKGSWELHFVLPSLKAGESLALKALLDPPDLTARPVAFHWLTKDGAPSDELYFGDRPVLRYEHAPLDESSAKAREATFKVYHHAYDPSGKLLLTKGVGGLFTHHRGLFYGFMKVTYDKQTVDIWHCKKETHQAHRAVERSAAGPVIGRHRVAIDWNGVGKKTFGREQRELTAWSLPGGTLIEFDSLLTPIEDDVKLDGDPQHAGFHFRASNEVDKKKKETVFIRPNGVGKPGVERNWPGDKKQVNLPWLAMSFVIGEKRYTAAYLDRPDNPKEARFSERTYGRFGSYFVTTVTKDRPLLVRYRVWLQEGQMTPDEVAARSRAFVEPVSVAVK
jgi:hypothetical protein